MNDPQHALHVTDYYCALAMAVFRSLGASQRKADRKLTDDEFDYDQFSDETDNGRIY